MVVGADDFLQDVMIQANGFGFLLCTIMYSAIAVTNSGTLLKTPRSKRSVEILWKNRSTMFNLKTAVETCRSAIYRAIAHRINRSINRAPTATASHRR